MPAQAWLARLRHGPLPNKPAVVLSGILLLCALAQIGAALWLVDSFDTPNDATDIAKNLVATGEYLDYAGWRLYGSVQPQSDMPLQMHQLPGEALYLAAGFSWLPASLWRFLHLPVMLLLVGSIMWCTRHFFGKPAAVIAGLLATAHPFLLLHGPVWDDTFVTAALDWLIVAVLLYLLGKHQRDSRYWGCCALLFVAAGFSVITRMQPLMVLGALVVAGLLWPPLKILRLPLCVMALGMATTLGSWAVRNHMISGQWIFGSTHDGVALWSSVYPHASAAIESGQLDYLNDDYMQQYWTAAAGMTEWEADNYFKQLAVDHILANPLATIRLGLVKLGLTFSGMNPGLALLTPRNVVALLTNLLAATAVVFALLAIDYRQWSNEKRLFVLFGFCSVGSSVLLCFIGPVGWRYRLELEGFVLMAAALSICRLLWRRQSRPRAGAGSFC